VLALQEPCAQLGAGGVHSTHLLVSGTQTDNSDCCQPAGQLALPLGAVQLH